MRNNLPGKRLSQRPASYACSAIILALLLLTPQSSFSDNTHDTLGQQGELGSWVGDLVAPYIVSGCLPSAPTVTLTLGAFACRGYVRGNSGDLIYVDQGPVSLTLPNTTGTHWLAISKDTTSVVSGWTRRPGTHYLMRQVTAKPFNPTNGVVFAAVEVAGGIATTVADYRIPRSYVLSQMYDPTDPLYGAVGDGVNDDTVALQTAIRAAGLTNSRVKIPAGIFTFTVLLMERGITLEGTGIPGDFVCCRDTDLPGTVLKQNSLTADGLNISAANGWAVRNLALIHPFAADPTAGSMIHITATTNNDFWTIENVLLSNVWAGITIDRGQNCTVDNVRILNPRLHGIRAQNLTASNNGSCHVSNATVTNLGFVTLANDFTPVPNISAGYIIEAGGFWCSHCNAVGPLAWGVVIEATNLSQDTSNVFLSDGLFVNHLTGCILIQRTAGTRIFKDIHIQGNECTNETPASGLVVSPTSGIQVVTVIGNTFSRSISGIQLQSGTGYNIHGNNFVEVAKAFIVAAGVTGTLGPQTYLTVPIVLNVASGSSLTLALTGLISNAQLPASAAVGSLIACTDCGAGATPCLVVFKTSSVACVVTTP